MNSLKEQVLLTNGEQLSIREATKEDALKLMNHLKQVDTETQFLGREPGEFNMTLEQEIEFIKGVSNNKQMCYLVALINDEIIGNVSAAVVRNNLRFLHRATLGITVKKKYWHKGVGQALMKSIIRWCKENSIEQLELEVVSSNKRAIRLYEAFGFKMYGTQKHAMKYTDGSYADHLFMIKDLKD